MVVVCVVSGVNSRNDLGKTDLEVFVEEACVAALHELVSMLLELFIRDDRSGYLGLAAEIVSQHSFAVSLDIGLFAEDLVVFFCLNELQPFAIEGIEFETVDVGAGVVHTYRLGKDYLASQAKISGATVPDSQLIAFSKELIEETERKMLN